MELASSFVKEKNTAEMQEDLRGVKKNKERPFFCSVLGASLQHTLTHHYRGTHVHLPPTQLVSIYKTHREVLESELE